ncbi:uncharacterized protein [Hyperolius riggenbachi]|uniref:uncharacterized protein n=1 Tax=Hyperolius riggenbachi TaxID=752182 RepID=UPI0035A294EC
MQSQNFQFISIFILYILPLDHASPTFNEGSVQLREGNLLSQKFCPQITCGSTSMNITFQKAELVALKIDLSNIHLLDPTCLGSADSETTISIQCLVQERVCGTQLMLNRTHAIYKNWIYLPPDPIYLIYRDEYIVNASCAYPRDMNVSLGTAVNPIISTTYITLKGIGEFKVVMMLFKDPAYSIAREKGDELSTRDMLYIGVYIAEGDKTRFNLVLKNCFATAIDNFDDNLKYYMIQDSCENEQDKTIHVAANGIASYGQFSIQAFKFIGGYSQVYLHCMVHLCDKQMGLCVPICPAEGNTNNNSSSQDSQISLGAITIKDPTDLCPDLQCGTSYINVTFQKKDLLAANVDLSSLHLNENKCHDKYESGSSFTLGWPLGEGTCGTTLTTNRTHAIYNNTIYLGPNPSQIIYREDYYINVSCVYPLDMNVSYPDGLIPIVSTTYIPIQGSGTFEVKMAIYKDASYLIPYAIGQAVISTKDRLYVGVFISKGDKTQFNLVMEQCYATPTNNPADTRKYRIILNSCPNEDDGTVQVPANGISSQSQFSFQMFKFIEYDTAYLHCQVHLCDKKSSCVPVCSRPKSRSAAEAGELLTLGPIRHSADDQTSPTVATTTNKSTAKESSVAKTTSKSAAMESSGKGSYLLTVIAVLFCMRLQRATEVKLPEAYSVSYD